MILKLELSSKKKIWFWNSSCSNSFDSESLFFYFNPLRLTNKYFLIYWIQMHSNNANRFFDAWLIGILNKYLPKSWNMKIISSKLLFVTHTRKIAKTSSHKVTSNIGWLNDHGFLLPLSVFTIRKQTAAVVKSNYLPEAVESPVWQDEETRWRGT